MYPAPHTGDRVKPGDSRVCTLNPHATPDPSVLEDPEIKMDSKRNCSVQSRFRMHMNTQFTGSLRYAHPHWKSAGEGGKAQRSAPRKLIELMTR